MDKSTAVALEDFQWVAVVAALLMSGQKELASEIRDVLFEAWDAEEAMDG